MVDLKTRFATLKQLMEEKGELQKDRILPVLRDLKMLMVQSPFLTNDEGKLPLEERVIFRDVLEYDAILAIKTVDTKSFTRVMKQLKSVYARQGENQLPKSEVMPVILTAWLIYLLTQSKVTEFNIEFPIVRKVVGANEFLDYASELEEAVSDNSFARIFKLQNACPHPYLSVFVAHLLDGARNSHADSVEQAYNNVTMVELATILHFANLDEAQAFVATRGWTVSADGVMITFDKKEDKGKPVVDEAKRYTELAVAISALQ